MQTPEPDLVQRLRRGDADAFQDMVDRHADQLYRMAFSLMGNAADAEDVVQQVFLGAFQRINSFEGRASLKTWLISILMNQASKARRSMRIRRTSALDENGDAGAAGGGGAGLHVRGPSAAVDSKVDVMAMLDTLNPEHRGVIVLRELQGLSYEEIATALQIPRGTVESRLFRARRELRQRFGGYLT